MKIFPVTLDLIADGNVWVKQNYPDIKQVFVFDKDDTLISSRKSGRQLHRHIVEHVLEPAHVLSDCLTVLYTLSSEMNLRRDLQQYPELETLFDVVITGDNFTEDLMIQFVEQKKLTGNPRELEWERIYKPVSKIFKSMKVVLLDDCAGTVWSLAEIGIDGVKAYSLEDDNEQNAKKIFQQCLAILS